MRIPAWSVCLALCGCDQEHVLLGRLPEPSNDAAIDAAPVDAASPPPDAPDASLPVDAALVDAMPFVEGPLDLQLRANGVLGVIAAQGCAGSCLELEAVPSGGAPPYELAWDDGTSGSTRTLCVAEHESVVARLGDRDVPLRQDGLLSFVNRSFALSDAQCTEPTPLRFAYDARRVQPEGCPGEGVGVVYALPEGLQPGLTLLVLSFSGSLFGASIRVAMSPDGCAANAVTVGAVGAGALVTGGSLCVTVGPDRRFVHLTSSQAETIFYGVVVDGISVCESVP